MTTPRPTSSAVLVWNNLSGWHWTDPATGVPVGGNRNVAPSDLRPGRDRGNLPAGWVATGGGSAVRVPVGLQLLDDRSSIDQEKSLPPSFPVDHFNHPPEVPEVVQDFYGFDTVNLVRANVVREIPLSPSTLALVPGGREFTYTPPGVAGAGAGISVAGRALRLIMGGGGGRLTAAIWNSLPSVVRSALVQAGIGVGALIAFNGDIPFITLPGQGPGTARSEGALPMVPELADRGVDIQVGRYYDGRLITKTWVANGIQFWATGSGRDRMHHVLKLDGSIKSWKPPRPVVLMPGGAKNIRDLLRADDIVDRQLKKVGKAIRRRSPSSRKPRSPQQVVIVDPQHAALH